MKYKEKLLTFSRKKDNISLNSEENSNDESEEKKQESAHMTKKIVSNRKETSFSYLRESINSLFFENSVESKRFSVFGHYFEENVSKDVLSIMKNRKNKHFLIKENEDMNPFLRHISLKAAGYLENPHLMEYEHKCFAEKISIKGAIWGQLIILKNSLIFCSLNDDRPENDPIFTYELHLN